MPRYSLALLALASSLMGCPQLKGGSGDAGTTSATAPAVDAAAATATSPPPATSVSTTTVDGVGDVPPWAAESTKGAPCKTSQAARPRIQALSKGDDDGISSNKTDPAALAKELAGDCRAATRELAEGLNNGGFANYKKKKYKEASRWWRDALVVRPSFITARYNLACALSLDGASKAAVAQVKEVARAADDGDASASNFLDKAKSDDDLAAVRNDADFKQALQSSTGTLVGPRKEPERSAEGVKLLPAEFKQGKNPVTGTMDTYKPALLQFWTWRPGGSTELLVATVVHDPATLGKPKGDMNNDYGGLVVLQGDPGKAKLLFAHKTGESPPTVAGGKASSVNYSFSAPCGDLHGNLTFKDGKVGMTEKKCGDL
jgi:hypothetical protein